jgi:hypothetical protein
VAATCVLWQVEPQLHCRPTTSHGTGTWWRSLQRAESSLATRTCHCPPASLAQSSGDCSAGRRCFLSRSSCCLIRGSNQHTLTATGRRCAPQKRHHRHRRPPTHPATGIQPLCLRPIFTLFVTNNGAMMTRGSRTLSLPTPPIFRPTSPNPTFLPTRHTLQLRAIAPVLKTMVDAAEKGGGPHATIGVMIDYCSLP